MVNFKLLIAFVCIVRPTTSTEGVRPRTPPLHYFAPRVKASELHVDAYQV